MQSSGKRLPADWGFQQYEVITDRAVDGRLVWWGLEDLRLPNTTIQGPEEMKEQEEEEAAIRESLEHRINEADSSEGGERKLSFWEKYFEIQVRTTAAIQCGNFTTCNNNMDMTWIHFSCLKTTT